MLVYNLRVGGQMQLATKPSQWPEASGGFDLKEFFPDRFLLTASHVSRIFARRYAEDLGLSFPEWRLLMTVGQRQSNVSQIKVGKSTAMSRVKVSRAAATLAAMGLLVQDQDPADGRGRLLRLTRKGAAVYRASISLSADLERQLAEGLSASEWNALQGVLMRLGTHVESLLGRSDLAEAEAGVWAHPGTAQDSMDRPSA